MHFPGPNPVILDENLGLRGHLSLTSHPSQPHPKGAIRPLPRHICWESSPSPSPPSLGVSKAAPYSQQDPPSNPALPSTTKSKFVLWSTCQAPKELRAINMCPHTHLLCKTRLGTPPQAEITIKWVTKDDCYSKSLQGGHAGTHHAACTVALFAARANPRGLGLSQITQSPSRKNF